MPSQKRVGRDDRREVAQGAASQPVPAHSEPPPVVIAQPESLPTQLPSQDAILFDQVSQGFVLPPGPFDRSDEAEVVKHISRRLACFRHDCSHRFEEYVCMLGSYV